ncbi:hypothetical protein [uncultured Mediterranean phage uvMED]|nr:hypothetical protein [uncultured Mediterranean phage uvMED]BAR17801.1 hypothetical protein [uncultured Mediterranean phage uvMED]
MAKKWKGVEVHRRIPKRTSIGNPKKTKLKLSSMNKHKRLNRGL